MQKHKGSNKHFTMRQRNYIEVSLSKGTSIIEIANYLRFSRQSVYKEIINNSYLKPKRSFDVVHNELTCSKLFKYPFVCNDCLNKYRCNKAKRYYYADKAHEKANLKKVNSRLGTRLSKGQLLSIEENLGPGLLKGQSIHHIVSANEEHFFVTERTIRNLINRGELRFRNIDLPMTVRFKKPKRRYAQISNKIKSEALLGRFYDDFKECVHRNDHYVQMDSVIGKQTDSKTIITIFFPKFSFIFGFISKEKGWFSVNNGILNIRDNLDINLYKRAFPFILTDRGSEFERLYLLEEDVIDGIKVQLSKVFYADPYTASQRAEIESNHRFIRRIIPKGKSFENLTQEHLDLMFSHINGLIRPTQNNKTGYELAKAYFGEEFLKAINITYIEPKDVVLKPSLFEKLK